MASKETVSGVVDRVKVDKGFGFIKTADRGSYFFHRSELVAPLTFGVHLEGQQVSFVPMDNAPKGPRALAVSAM